MSQNFGDKISRLLRNEKTTPKNPMTSSQRRVCDYCNDATAVLYCRADSAKLCFSCDREVHGTNQLFGKHARSQLCDACDGSPAAIFCSTESFVLCQNCDWESHNDAVSAAHHHHHHRRPLEGFNGCPSVTELLAILGFEDVDKKALFWGEESGFFESEDLLIWDVPSVVALDDLIVSDSSRSFQAMGVPPLPKNRNAVCGQHKAEIVRQLGELAKKEPDSNYENMNLEYHLGFEAIVPDSNVKPERMCVGSQREAEEEPNSFSTVEGRSYRWGIDSIENVHQDVLPQSSLRSHLQESHRDSEKHSDIGDTASLANDAHNQQTQHPVDSNALPDFPKIFPYELTSQERETAISRYKEKRKTRRYDKRIRYESRKVRAESRTRVKGRFAKINH